ncbi:EamA-like transporter family protein [Acinetobacter sp. WC-323]|uniref:DMT family transporter n=1 Tax=Acinetobacter sp. WC-323 TaxID=903918 RepID=UPI00029E4500|nr:SMR family transporter [Acinetobacter sp. WC-323]EKU50880.1 EamA-like transporter family protein [Acinetobacter sp. WC-323]
MSWLLLIASGILEIFVVKSIRDITQKKYRTAIPLYAISLSSSLFLLHMAMETIDVSIAYAVYTGIGVVGTILMGVFFWNERRSLEKFFYVSLIVSGVIILKVST